MSYPHTINTKSPTEVLGVVMATFEGMGFAHSVPLLDRLFQDVLRMFGGQHPGYLSNDVHYHDLEHTLQAAVCLCKILAGRHSADAQPALGRRDCELAFAAVLLHDTGYLKRTHDTTGTGAKYTLVHVRRSYEFAREYLLPLGFNPQEIEDVAAAISCTGPANKISQVRFSRPEARIIATVLVTADYLGQMAAPDYVEKLPILYREFEEAYIFENLPGHLRPFRNEVELIQKTPDFWRKFVKPMLPTDLEGVYCFIAPDAKGANPYLVAIEQNIARLRPSSLSDFGSSRLLKAKPPQD